MIKIVRTHSENPDFIKLVDKLNNYLKIVDGEDHAFYNQYNNIDVLKHVVIIYDSKKAVGCGAFKAFDKNTVEIKRMFTTTESRNKGIASIIIQELENWAKEIGYTSCVLETGKRQIEAVNFYKKMDYMIIPNYGPYKKMENSVCFKKQI